MKKLAVTFALTFMFASANAQEASTPTPVSSVVDMLHQQDHPPSTEVLGVVLTSDAEPVKLESYGGTLSYTYAFVTALMFLDFPGQHASSRTHSARPVLHVRVEADPTNRMYLVRAESNKRTDNRSVKIGHSGFGSISGMSAPDTEWAVPFTVQRESEDVWTITPTQDLKAGEYGLFVPTVANGTQVPANAQLYGFGIDK